MAGRPLLLWVCCALGLAGGCSASDPRAPQPPEGQDTLQDESDNQENVLSQLLGDYDKVKAVSEGADCKCKCVVRPLGREACRRVEAGTARMDDSYTVETITSGPACKCACLAPPSALNPCEGDFRLQKLREADGRDLKLSTVLDMLEGAAYGLDLLKLHSVTTKLLGRVDRLEEEVSRNLTQENEQIKEHIAEIRSEVSGRSREGCCRAPPDSQPDPASHVQLDAAAAYARPEVDAVELLDTRPLAQPAVARPPRPPHRPAEPRGRPASRPTIIRGITYYKAQEPDEDEKELEEPQDEFFSGDHEMDLLSEEQLLRHEGTVRVDVDTQPPPGEPDTTAPASSGQWSTALQDVGDTSTPMVTLPPPASVEPLTTVADATYTVPTLPTVTGTEAMAGWGTVPASPTLSPEEEEDIRSTIGKCKDTLSTISGPTPHNTYGRNEGAWMKDPLAEDERIYVTNYHYGNTVVEFRNPENFKQGRWSNSYKLPYSWVGTGHAVYGGAFFFSRAFTRTIIKYDLRRRYVAAWALLHDVAYEEATPWRWRGHSDVHFAVDENGLWLVYPALDEDGAGQEVMVLSKLDAADLSTRRETTWRTGLRRHRYGSCFVVCGVLYAVDSARRRHANVSYAFDTHTNTQTAPRLPFENRHAHTAQVAYNPKDRLLYAWDNGHQLTYRLIFAY